ncbi:hypothetical protein [Arthrobacter sp. NPDC092385]|uniref:hypothetical protein n=1 Tax=Arthrobacter sp. NPDC092385 TaxID=3363943 RepID=UPI00382E5DA4
MRDIPEGGPQEGPNKRPPDTYRAAAALHAAAIDLSHCRARFVQPSESHATLGELIEVQQHLMNVLQGLCQWHQQVQAGTDFADQRQSVDGVLEAAFELQTALQHADSLHQALIRAHHAGTQVRWYTPDTDPHE